jgi:hypothetical protein
MAVDEAPCMVAVGFGFHPHLSKIKQEGRWRSLLMLLYDLLMLDF